MPEEILNKPGAPDEAEWSAIRRHPDEGRKLVEPLAGWLGPWARAVEDHHERWDGGGYPRGIHGPEISLGGRILAIADAYEVMTAARPYRRPLRPDVARRELVDGAGIQFDPDLVRGFLNASLGPLWAAMGTATALAQLPLLWRLWGSSLGDRLRRALTAPAGAVVVVVTLAMTGLVGGETAASKGRMPAADALPGPPAGRGESGTPDAGARGEPAGAGTGVDAVAAFRRPSGPARTNVATIPAGPVASADGNAGVLPSTSSPLPGSPAGAAPAYTATGRILVPALLNTLHRGITEGEFRSTCRVPRSQGLDAWVFDLPPQARLGGTPVRVRGRDALGLHELDVAFFSDTCEEVGRLTGTGRDEEGVLPAGGTRFVVVAERMGVGTEVELRAG